MTTASSLAFTTMEISVADDQMEMASPYQGHADDFDIDIDIMEDQASTTDRDMMGADEYLDYDHDGAYDADMIDDVAEPTMEDVDDPYAEAGYTVEMQDGNERIYEAEMLEDDYDEDIDAPVAEVQGDVPASEQAQNSEVEGAHPLEEITTTAGDKDQPREELHLDQQTEPLAQDVHHTVQDTEQHVDLSEEKIPREYEVDTAELPENGKPLDDSKEAGREVLHATETDERENNMDHTRPAQPQASSPVDAQPSPDEREEPVAETGDKEEEGGYKEGDVGDVEDGEVQDEENGEGEVQEVAAVSENQVSSSEEQAVEHRPEQREPPATERTALYPVKVYYQDNEISLFPPREGDSSETFFLEDESLAFESFGKLFESCREVLRDHISDSDVLVVDVEALNIQLTEDSLHIDKVTLHQIVDLYLRLSHNDGIEEPEALYLTLSTRPTIFAEVSNLLVAANEGKGLSEIYWDGYAEAEATSADVNEDDHEEFNPDYLEQDSSEPDDDRSESERDHEPETESTLQEVITDEQQDQQGKQDHEDHDHTAPDNDEAVGPSSDNFPEGDDAEDDNLHEADLAETDATKVGDHQLPNEDVYDSEEQSESTATVTQLPQPGLADEQQLDSEAGNVFDDQDDHEYHGTEGADDEAYPEEETNVDATEQFSFHEDAAAVETGDNTGEAVGEIYGDVTEPNAEELHETAFKDIHDATHSRDDTVDDDFHDHEDIDGEAPQSSRGEEALYEDTEPVSDSVSQDIPEITNKPTQDLEDDSLGIAEDLLKNPSKVIKQIGEDTNADEPEPGELHDGPQHTPAAHDEVEELTFDDEEYLDLGLQEGADDEAIVAKSPSRAPAKRYREPEDDFELTEIPTPDAKRSRSS